MAFTHFDSIDAQAEQLVGFDQEYHQLEAGHYAGAFLTHKVGDLSLAVEHTNRALHQAGAGALGQLSAVFLMSDGNQQSRVNGQRFTANDVLLIPEGRAYESVVVAGAVPAVLSVPVTLNTCAAFRTGDDVGPLGDIGRTSNARLAEGFRSLVRAAVQLTDAPSAIAAESALHRRVNEAGHALVSQLHSDVSGELARGHDTFRWARSILISDIAANLSIAKLAKAVGVSRRTLDASFQASVGVSPARFRKLLRLNHARRLIESGDCSVTSAAVMSGLHHLGRFSSDYRELFDELPSSTRHRHL